jgi:hypothetical protein
MMIDVRKEHPEYVALNAVWPKYRDMYAGGEQFTARASQYLIPRLREPGEVFLERTNRAFYENYIGSIIDWYAATLFRREPTLTFEGQDDQARQFYGEFADDCDLRGSTLSDFFRRQTIEALVAGRSYVAIDFPDLGGKAKNRAEEDKLGLSRAYLCEYAAESLVNWQRNERGEFDWVVLKTERRADEPEASEWVTKRRWVYYGREEFQIYDQIERGGHAGPVELVKRGLHGLAKQKIVPVVEFNFGEGMWLMNKAASLQLEHFNKSNALGWALTMGLFAMPVVYSDREWQECVGESYYLQLGPQDKFGWTEPEGHVYEVAMQNIDRLKEEIYRVCYVLSQALGSQSKNTQLTGLSKQRDYQITQEVLRGFGDRVKDTLKKILRMVSGAREDAILIDVTGLDEFDIGDFSSELLDAEKLLSLGIGSETFRAQVLKKLAAKYLCDVRQEIKGRIADEIDASLGVSK